MRKRNYTLGYVLSVILTLAAYLMTKQHISHGWTLIYLLAVLAIIQLTVQLYFFLHLGQEKRPRWNLIVFGFAFMVVFILVFGSLWIMQNLSYPHELTPQQASNYLVKDEGYQQ